MLRLALYRLRYHRVLSGLMVLCLTITLFLPLVTYLAVDRVEERLYARSSATPILVGSKGSPFLLTFNAIYFKTRLEERLHQAAYHRVRKRVKGEVIPLHTFHTVRGLPVVGTSYDYFAFRGLNPAEGGFPTLLGDAVLGAEAAKRLRARVGGSVISDSESVYDLSAEYPLKMRVTGILAPTGTPDDLAVFTDVKTAWVIDGIGHGHDDLAATMEEAATLDLADGTVNPDDSVLFIESSEIVYNSRLKKYNEITAENLHTFHFHGNPEDFPLSALIVLPDSYEEEVVDLLAGLNLTQDLQAVRPRAVVRDLLDILLDFKRVLDGFSGLVIVSTAAFMVLVLGLQIRQRRGEMTILYRIGGGRHTVQCLLALEVGILLTVSAILALGAALAVAAAIRSWIAG